MSIRELPGSLHTSTFDARSSSKSPMTKLEFLPTTLGTVMVKLQSSIP